MKPKVYKICEKIARLTECLCEKRFGLTLREAIDTRAALEKALLEKTGKRTIYEVTPELVIDSGCSYDWIRYNALRSVLTAYSEMMNARIWAIGLTADDFTGVAK